MKEFGARVLLPKMVSKMKMELKEFKTKKES